MRVVSVSPMHLGRRDDARVDLEGCHTNVHKKATYHLWQSRCFVIGLPAPRRRSVARDRFPLHQVKLICGRWLALLAPLVCGLHQPFVANGRIDAITGSRHRAVRMDGMSKGRGSAREGWVRHHQQRSRAKPQTEKEVPPPKPMSAVTTSQAIELAETDIDAAEASLAEALLAHFEQQETCLEDALVALSALPAAPAIDHGDLERENREASERRAQRAAKFGTGSQQQEAGHNGSPQLDAFEAAILLCEARELLPPDSTVDLSDDVPRLLHQAFDQDFEQLLLREKVVTNVTCMQPADEGCGSELFNDELLKLTLKPGRVCEGGACGEACSRVAFPLFASPHECEAFRELLESSMTPPLHHFELAKCAFRSLRTTLVFVRLIERMRRAIAYTVA